MRGRFLTVSGIIGFALLVTDQAAAADRAEAVDRAALRVCADPAAPPLSTEDGKGMENEIAELFARDLGVPVRYTWFPSTIGFFRRTLNARRCDIVMGVVTGVEMSQTTKPYYRSTYVLITRKEDGIGTDKLDDASLRNLKIGVQARTPPADVLAATGMLDNLHAYELMVDSRHTSVGQQLIDDLKSRKIDAAVIWGPIGAFFAGLSPDALTVTPLSSQVGRIPLAFDISMAVRYGEPAWRSRVDRFIRDRRKEIEGILAAYKVPVLPLPKVDQ